MTEEDQKLVALAALHGARFTRRGQMWGYEDNPSVAKWTIGRAAAFYLYKNDLMPREDWQSYDLRSATHLVQEIDPQFIASVLS